jgi:hypothetical protein
MTQPDRTHHERVLHHLRNATSALEASRTKSIAQTQSHLDNRAPVPVATTNDTTDAVPE